MWKLLCRNSAFLRGSKSPPMNGSPVSMITSLPTFSCSFTILKMWKSNSAPSFPQIRIAVCHKKLCDSKFPFHNLVVRVETWNLETFICHWVKAFDLLRRFHIRWVLKCIRRSRTGGWRWMGQYQKAPWRLTSDFCQMGMCVWLYSSYVISSQ